MSFVAVDHAIDDETETIAVVTHIEESSRESEVVYRRTMLERAGESNSSLMNESGNPEMMTGLLELAASRYGTTVPKLLHKLSGVPSAKNALLYSLPPSLARYTD